MDKPGFVQDHSGLYHFQWKVGGTTVEDAAAVALEDHPGSAAWFWFNGIPAPIYMDDTLKALVDRWRQWSAAREAGLQKFLEMLIDLAPKNPIWPR